MDHATDPDWTLLRSFLAVAETGSLSAAARQLGISQPTLGRHVATLHDSLGSELFTRIPKGLRLTDTGAALVEPARAMQAAARRIALTAAGEQAELAGTVRITASTVTATHHLPPIVARLRREEPRIAVEIVPTDDSRNLLWREADIAVRMYRPAQLDLVARHLGNIPLAPYAAKSYLAGRPRPTADTITDHDWIGHDASTQIIEGFRAAGAEVTRDFFGTRCDDHRTYWALVRAGCGIGFAQTPIGDADPAVERLDLDFPLPTLPLWLVAPEAMRRTPRIRRVWQALEEGLTPLVT